MGQAWIDFDAPDLRARIERLNDAERNVLPFGVIHLDRDGTRRKFLCSFVHGRGLCGGK
jgi:hypothetical protein